MAANPFSCQYLHNLSPLSKITEDFFAKTTYINWAWSNPDDSLEKGGQGSILVESRKKNIQIGAGMPLSALLNKIGGCEVVR